MKPKSNRLFADGERAYAKGKAFHDGQSGDCIVERLLDTFYKVRRWDGKHGYATSKMLTKKENHDKE